MEYYTKVNLLFCTICEFTYKRLDDTICVEVYSMAMSAQERVKKYQAKRDAIMIRPSKEAGQEIRAAASDAGQSVQAYILQAVRDRMSREKTT